MVALRREVVGAAGNPPARQQESAFGQNERGGFVACQLSLGGVLSSIRCNPSMSRRMK